jgi:hypothetical protein
MDVKLKVTAMHTVTALIAAVLSAVFSLGLITAVGKNDLIAGVIGIVVLYITGQLSERIFGKEEIGGFKAWLGDGIIPFFCVWFVLWTVIFNYLGHF